MQNVTVERAASGRPGAGKTFVAIHAHSSDIPRYASGLCAKLIAEGYTGYVVRTTNDEKSGGHSAAQNILSNEQDHLKMAEVLGIRDVFDLYYRNRMMEDIAPAEFQSRLVLLLRMLKADTVISFHPSPAGDDDTDHRATGHAVEQAVLMAGLDSDFHEHFEAGFQPHKVLETYYFCTRAEQPYNRVVDIGPHIEKKIGALVESKSQGGGNAGSLLRARLAREGRRLPLLGADDRTADREYARQFLLDEAREYGRAHGLEYAERFFYIDERKHAPSKVDEYVEKNAIRI